LCEVGTRVGPLSSKLMLFPRVTGGDAIRIPVDLAFVAGVGAIAVLIIRHREAAVETVVLALERMVVGPAGIRGTGEAE